MHLQKTLRFAVMCNGRVFQRWQADSIRQLMERNHKPVLLIRDMRIPEKPGFFKKILTYRWSNLLFFLCYRFFFRFQAKTITDLSQELKGVDELPCYVEKQGFSEYFDPDDIETIKSYKIDFILRFGFNILRGGILNAAEHGVWSFHHDDETKYRGGPAGFWEIYYKDRVNAAILQQLTERLDAGIILKKGWFKTIDHSYSGNLDQLLFESSSWVVQAATDISNELPLNAESSKTSAPVYQVPGNVKMIRFLLRLTGNKLRFHFNQLFRSERWNIALINRPVASALYATDFENEHPQWLTEPPSGSYYADPFPYILNKKVNVLFEHFIYSNHKASIARVGVENGVFNTSIVEVFSGPNHLSYPFILENGGDVYFLPESFRDRRIDIYRLDPVNNNFVFIKSLLTGIDAVDPTLFEYDSRWWLFFSLKRQSNTILYAYYSDDLLGEYCPHLNNPIKTDIRSARPAGTPFRYEGALYRPGQDCSMTYGGQVVINRVIKLNPAEFEEMPVKTISPFKNSKYLNGLHTISGSGTVTIIDGKRFVFNKAVFTEQLFRKLHKLRDRK